MFLQTFILLVVLTSIRSEPEVSADRWLPKCCPKGKQISGGAVSCVEDRSDSLEYLTEGERRSPADVLLLEVNNRTLDYRLEYRGAFACARHEVRVIDEDNFRVVEEEDAVEVEDDLGARWTLPKTEVCVDSVWLGQVSPGRLRVALLCPDCRRVPCLHKCCPETQQLAVAEGGAKVDCVARTAASWTHQFMQDTKRPFVFHGFPECSHSLYLDFPKAPLVLLEHGHVGVRGVTVPRAEYCGDHSPQGSTLLACRQMPTMKPALYGALFCVGAVFLGLTLGLHLWLPELRKSLHSRVLIAHVACLLVGYLGLALVNLAPPPVPSTTCCVTAFIIQYAILAAIFWLNVMCVDIAWTFSGLRAPRASLSLDSDGHKFLYYSLYAWGTTSAISAATALMEYSPLLPPSSRLKPSFNVARCWFQAEEAILLYVYGPMGLLLLANIVLFVYTAVKIQRTQRDTADIIQHAGSKLRENKDRFALYLKLFGLMGVTWVFEVVSWLVGGPDSLWYVTDIINALRGVFIFALFCLKKKVYVLVKAKLCHQKTPKFPMHPRKSTSSRTTSSMTSQRTNSFQLSQVS